MIFDYFDLKDTLGLWAIPGSLFLDLNSRVVNMLDLAFEHQFLAVSIICVVLLRVCSNSDSVLLWSV